MTSLAPRRSRQFSSQPARRGDPVAEIEQLQDRMGSLLQSFFADPFPTVAAGTVPMWVPPADIEEIDDAYLVEIDLPGVRADDVNLELRDNNELRITGQYRDRERSGIVRRQNRRTGQFEYVVVLPGEVDPEKIDAMLEDGVLMVRLARSMGGQGRRIEIKASNGGSLVHGSARSSGHATGEAGAQGSAQGNGQGNGQTSGHGSAQGSRSRGRSG
jgi:HSP20 family protein